MKTNRKPLEFLTEKWWFYLLVVLLIFFLPNYSARPYDPRNTSAVIAAVMEHASIYSFPAFLPVFKVIPILLIAAILVWGDRATRFFDGYVAFTLLLFALFQNAALTQDYGLVVLVGNTAVYAGIACLWGWETVVKRNDFTPHPLRWWKYWVVPVALLAFWFPVNLVTLRPDFSPLLLLTSEAGLTTCMMVPVYLAVVVLFEPKINRPVVRVTSFVGIVTAFLNLLQWFVLNPHLWIGTLHLPLLVISAYAFILSVRRDRAE
jgi:hypothetical protein